MVPQSTTAEPTTETALGMGDTMVPARPHMERTAAPTPQLGYNPSTGTYARGASTSTAYGTQKVGQAYNPYTGAYGATHQGSNAYSNWGSSTMSKDGQTVDTQHYSGANGTVGTAESSSGNRYATANGNVYKNTGSGWERRRPILMLHTVGEAAVVRTITAAAHHLHSAAGAIILALATPAGDPDLRARRAGAAEAAVEVGAAEAVVAGGGRR